MWYLYAGGHPDAGENGTKYVCRVSTYLSEGLVMIYAALTYILPTFFITKPKNSGELSDKNNLMPQYTQTSQIYLQKGCS